MAPQMAEKKTQEPPAAPSDPAAPAAAPPPPTSEQLTEKIASLEARKAELEPQVAAARRTLDERREALASGSGDVGAVKDAQAEHAALADALALVEERLKDAIRHRREAQEREAEQQVVLRVREIRQERDALAALFARGLSDLNLVLSERVDRLMAVLERWVALGREGNTLRPDRSTVPGRRTFPDEIPWPSAGAYGEAITLALQIAGNASRRSGSDARAAAQWRREEEGAQTAAAGAVTTEFSPGEEEDEEKGDDLRAAFRRGQPAQAAPLTSGR